MPRKQTYARISITLPRDVLAAADRQADALARPRSWVIAEAIRGYQAGPPGAAESPGGSAEVAAARRRRLLADLRCTPEERLKRATVLLRLAPARATGRGRGRGRRQRAQIIGFDSYEEFAAWKKARRADRSSRT